MTKTDIILLADRLYEKELEKRGWSSWERPKEQVEVREFLWERAKSQAFEEAYQAQQIRFKTERRAREAESKAIKLRLGI